jgi:hypothetical protein
VGASCAMGGARATRRHPLLPSHSLARSVGPSSLCDELCVFGNLGDLGVRTAAARATLSMFGGG